MTPSRSLRPLAVRLALASAPLASAPLAAPAAASLTLLPCEGRAQTATSADQFFVNDGVWLRYRVIGTGAPLLMLNTEPARDETMLTLARALGTSHRVILLDARGFGSSGRPLDAHQYGAAFVDDALLLLDALKVPKADVLGHATGALVAAALTAHHPERVRRLVLLDGPVYRDAARLPQLLAPTVASLEASLPKRAERDRLSTEIIVVSTRPTVRATAKSAVDTATRATGAAATQLTERRAMLAALQSLPSLVVAERDVARLRVPVLAAAGGRDPFADATRELGAWWPGAQSVVVDGVSREGVLTDAKVVTRVRDFLR